MRADRRWIIVAASVLAIVSARPYAGGWNDGSRLATVESLVDRHTFAIDDSIYITPSIADRPPYQPGNELAARYGTADKLLINGRYFSDKSPVPALPMAGVYQLAQWLGGLTASHRPDLFALLLTWLFAGIPYVLAIWALQRALVSIALPPPWNLILLAGFAFATLAAPYAAQVNNHILLLAVGAGISEAVVRRGPMTIGRGAWLGLLAGFGYTIDLGAGPPLFVAVFGFVALHGWATRHWWPLATFLCAALPLLITHHAITYAIAGTIGPANANPVYLQWPGSPFNSTNTTGGWAHASVGKAILYSLDLLFGKKGFLLYSPLLLLVLAAIPFAFTRPGRDRRAIVAMTIWAMTTWALYAATSRNLSGECLSIRWFVPLIAPAVVAIGVLIRDVPAFRRDLVVFVVAGLVLNVEFIIRGPWDGRVPWLYWPIMGIAVTIWLILLARRVPAGKWPTPRRIVQLFTRRKTPSVPG